MFVISPCDKSCEWEGYAHLLVQSNHGGSVLEFLGVVLGSSAASLAVGDDLDSTLVAGRGEVHLEDLSTDVAGKLQEREGWARLDDDGLKTILKHV